MARRRRRKVEPDVNAALQRTRDRDGGTTNEALQRAMRTYVATEHPDSAPPDEEATGKSTTE